jgi:hypothetical protein
LLINFFARNRFFSGETIKKDALWHVVLVLAVEIYAFCNGKLENWVTFDGDFT